jgi:ribosome biogenesis ATPase
MDSCVEKVLELVAMPLAHPEVYLHTGVQPPRGVLLHGPSGCGKTLLANAIGGVRISQTGLFILAKGR